MGFLDLLKGNGMDAYVQKASEIGATLVDVRNPKEFVDGHVPGAISIPLNTIQTAEKKLADKNAALYVYCLSGGRSSQACAALKSMGYTNVTNIGGISAYGGPVEYGD